MNSDSSHTKNQSTNQTLTLNVTICFGPMSFDSHHRIDHDATPVLEVKGENKEVNDDN